MPDIVVTTVVEGEFDARVDTKSVRVFLPPGLGVAGFDDELFVTYLLAELSARNVTLAPVVDVAQIVGAHPGLLECVADALDTAHPDTV
jgi:hypothetical protein